MVFLRVTVVSMFDLPNIYLLIREAQVVQTFRHASLDR